MMNKHLFPRQHTHAETVSLATAAYPLPCIVSVVFRYPDKIRKPECFANRPGGKHAKQHHSLKFNRARRQKQ